MSRGQRVVSPLTGLDLREITLFYKHFAPNGAVEGRENTQIS
jgi:hypothetical protein